MGELSAYEIAWVAKMLTGAELNVNEINPYKIEAGKSAEMRRIEAWQAKRKLTSFFKSLRGEE